MKRRQILRNWPWLVGAAGARAVPETPPLSKESTPSEVIEYVRLLAAEPSSGRLPPIASPNERQSRKQANDGERRASDVE